MKQTLQTKLVKAQISNTAPTAARCKWRAWLHSVEPSNCWDELSVFVPRNMPNMPLFATFCCYPSNLWPTLVRSIQPWWVDAFERELCQACAKRDGYTRILWFSHIFTTQRFCDAFCQVRSTQRQRTAICDSMRFEPGIKCAMQEFCNVKNHRDVCEHSYFVHFMSHFCIGSSRTPFDLFGCARFCLRFIHLELKVRCFRRWPISCWSLSETSWQEGTNAVL